MVAGQFKKQMEPQISSPSFCDGATAPRTLEGNGGLVFGEDKTEGLWAGQQVLLRVEV